jgi:hypothetical protein
MAGGAWAGAVCVPFESGVPFRSVPFRSVPFRSVPFRSVPFRSVPFRSVRLRVPGNRDLHVLTPVRPGWGLLGHSEGGPGIIESWPTAILQGHVTMFSHKMRGFHGCDYEECRLLGCHSVRVL